MNLARANGYKTVQNAKHKLTQIVGNLDECKMHWVIAVNEEGRYVPCIISAGINAAFLCHNGITCLGN